MMTRPAGRALAAEGAEDVVADGGLEDEAGRLELVAKHPLDPGGELLLRGGGEALDLLEVRRQVIAVRDELRVRVEVAGLLEEVVDHLDVGQVPRLAAAEARRERARARVIHSREARAAGPMYAVWPGPVRRV